MFVFGIGIAILFLIVCGLVYVLKAPRLVCTNPSEREETQRAQAKQKSLTSTSARANLAAVDANKEARMTKYEQALDQIRMDTITRIVLTGREIAYIDAAIQYLEEVDPHRIERHVYQCPDLSNNEIEMLRTKLTGVQH